MIFVVEGPDGSGKTTLIKNIRADKRRNTHFLSSSAQPASTATIQNEIDWIHRCPGSMVLFCDRYRLISEPIYGNILRGVDLSIGVHPRISQLVTFIYCRPPHEAIVSNLGANTQLTGVIQNIDRIIDAYDEMFATLHPRAPVEMYDYTSHDAAHNAAVFINHLFHRWVPRG